MKNQDTIVAKATGTGGAIAIIRLSGPQAITLAERVFCSHNHQSLETAPGFTLHYGTIQDGHRTVDDVLLSLFRAPHSYTGEEMVEISCHASPYIEREITRLLTDAGARTAEPGEFTLRAFLAGKMDLSQAEAVADLIASGNRSSHTLATRQMRGGYSDELDRLRHELLKLVSLLELELDFSEEDVEFADRTQLSNLLDEIGHHIDRLLESFTLGNAIKNGVPVAIVGAPNVGKSTLLNALLGEEKALVSDIAGTTRDVIEDTITLDGIAFRFIDTAGIRQTDDPLETMGIERTFDRIAKASVVLMLADIRTPQEQIMERFGALKLQPDQRLAIILNKCDKLSSAEVDRACHGLMQQSGCAVLALSAKHRIGLDRLEGFLRSVLDTRALENDTMVVFNSRHIAALSAARQALTLAQVGLSDALPGDLLAQNIREVLYHIGTITGEITTDQILQEIFSKFCIGK